jgi:hypothetical protein
MVVLLFRGHVEPHPVEVLFGVYFHIVASSANKARQRRAGSRLSVIHAQRPALAALDR